MKEKLKNKKVVYTIIGIVSVLLVALAVTYAYWLITKTQTGENQISSACLDISISGEKNDITLSDQFPISDEDGMKLVPYEFTVTNNCNTSVDYQVALEATGDKSNALKGTSLKVALNNNTKLYSAYPSVETTIEGAYESRVLGYSKLTGAGSEGSSVTYSLRIWIDEEAPISEMNKTFKSQISITVGQGIESPYEEGTLAYDILANYNGVNTISEIDATEYAHRIMLSGDVYINNFFYYGTDYTFDETTKQYVLSGDVVRASVDTCRRGYTIEYDYVNCEYDSDLEYDVCEEIEIKTPINCGKYTLQTTKLTDKRSILYEVTDWNSTKGDNYVTGNTISYNKAFESSAAVNEMGVYKTQDDLGVSYYYRGNVSNNYVEFGSYAENSEVNGTTYTEETPMYWRIIRINGDGTIRLVYDGTTKAANGIANNSMIGYSAYNTEYNDPKYVGYTYDDGTGTQVDSTIKGIVDAWYDAHLEKIYGEYIADSIFCNDKSIAKYDYMDENWDIITDPNAAVYTNIYYGANKRINNYMPTLKCPNQSDRYTVDDTANGNGVLAKPIGLMTIDEAVFAGGYYLDSQIWAWTSSPATYSSPGDGSVYTLERGQGALNPEVDTDGGIRAVRPVINLKADVEFTGNGTIDNPYKIVTE